MATLPQTPDRPIPSRIASSCGFAQHRAWLVLAPDGRPVWVSRASPGKAELRLLRHVMACQAARGWLVILEGDYAAYGECVELRRMGGFGDPGPQEWSQAEQAFLHRREGRFRILRATASSHGRRTAR